MLVIALAPASRADDIAHTYLEARGTGTGRYNIIISRATVVMKKLSIIHLVELAGLLALILTPYSTEAFSHVPVLHKCRRRRQSTYYLHNKILLLETAFNNDRSSKTRLWRGYDGGGGTSSEMSNNSVDPLIAETSLKLRRVSWFSWWCQVILTTVSSVILLFARNVATRNRGTLAELPTFLLSGVGVAFSCASIVWTWGNGARLSRRLVRKPTSLAKAAALMRRAQRVGVSLNLVGLFITLLGAAQIVGTLAIKVLTSRTFGTAAAASMMVAETGVQPLDILVVQSNTNMLLSHFCSLASFLYLTDRIDKLDPPSTEGKKRT